jgi:hypothetical protein
LLQHLKKTIWVEYYGLPTQIVIFLHSSSHPQTDRVTVQSWCSFTGNVLPIHHTICTLHQATSTSLDHWRSTKEKNI